MYGIRSFAHNKFVPSRKKRAMAAVEEEKEVENKTQTVLRKWTCPPISKSVFSVRVGRIDDPSPPLLVTLQQLCTRNALPSAVVPTFDVTGVAVSATSSIVVARAIDACMDPTQETLQGVRARILHNPFGPNMDLDSLVPHLEKRVQDLDATREYASERLLVFFTDYVADESQIDTFRVLMARVATGLCHKYEFVFIFHPNVRGRGLLGSTAVHCEYVTDNVRFSLLPSKLVDTSAWTTFGCNIMFHNFLKHLSNPRDALRDTYVLFREKPEQLTATTGTGRQRTIHLTTDIPDSLHSAATDVSWGVALDTVEAHNALSITFTSNSSSDQRVCIAHRAPLSLEYTLDVPIVQDIVALPIETRADVPFISAVLSLLRRAQQTEEFHLPSRALNFMRRRLGDADAARVDALVEELCALHTKATRLVLDRTTLGAVCAPLAEFSKEDTNALSYERRVMWCQLEASQAFLHCSELLFQTTFAVRTTEPRLVRTFAWDGALPVPSLSSTKRLYSMAPDVARLGWGGTTDGL